MLGIGVGGGGPRRGSPPWFVTDWQLPLACAIAAEPDLKERIYRKSSCEFSFFSLRAGGGAKTNLKPGTPLIRLESCGTVSQTTAKHRGNISWQR